jgi:DNA-binding transcriptional LysR family regulator
VPEFSQRRCFADNVELYKKQRLGGAVFMKLQDWSHNMDQTDWEVLKTLYEEENITNAAKRLYLSQPALTNRLQRIEREFGTQIVTRGRKGIQFTYQGKYLAQLAEEMIVKLDMIKQNIQNMSDEMVGVLRIGSLNFFADNYLPSILSKYTKKYPNVKVEVFSNKSELIYRKIYNKMLNVAFIRGSYVWTECEKTLWEEDISVFNSHPFELSDLAQMSRVEYDMDVTIRNMIDTWWIENFHTVPVVTIKVDRADTCKSMVLNDLGYAIMPEKCFSESEKEALYSYPLVYADGRPLIRKTRMIYHEDNLSLKIVRAFIEMVSEMFDSK